MDGLRLPVQIAEDGKALFEIESELPGGRWILFELLGNKQIGDSVELSEMPCNISETAL